MYIYYEDLDWLHHLQFCLVLVQSKHSKILDQATRTRGYILLVYTLDSLRISSITSTNRFKLLNGGTYRVRGTAEKATVKNS
ncbi:telomerase reverse transcriptase-like [Senna tora]|uniref:Telomerase reverse transcriptase-like n=1 Tax=Senna tora TaxID=362788 RepID=A0A834X1W5_9FABA|nr:telomerase reverse transcriptase-like [Senna tora]